MILVDTGITVADFRSSEISSHLQKALKHGAKKRGGEALGADAHHGGNAEGLRVLGQDVEEASEDRDDED